MESFYYTIKKSIFTIYLILYKLRVGSTQSAPKET